MPDGRTHLWFSHELCNFHDPGTAAGYLPVGPMLEPFRGYAADPDQRRAEALVKVAGVMDHYTQRTPRPATDEELLAVHSKQMIRRTEQLAAQGGGDAGAYAPVGYHSAQAARLACGAAVEAVEAVMARTDTDAYCLVRPPGHHAEPDRGMALCLFNNVAVAVRAAQRQQARRVMIIDWDVHHGNGIQKSFIEDPDVLYVSIHQAGLFPPGSGTVLETGMGAGVGTTMNIPLPPGSGHGAYEACMDRLITPAARAFQPDLIVVAAGVDASGHDPMGRMMLTAAAFHALTRSVMALTAELCDGRLVMVQEGGYSDWYNPMCVLSIASALAGLPAPVDPFHSSLANLPGQYLQPHQELIVEHLSKHHPIMRHRPAPAPEIST